jgi:cystathionine beta-lyase/cystathionine gamma-synthase
LGAEKNYFQLSIGLENIEEIKDDLQQALLS